ncbi:hypothetical protein [Thiomicrospira microaerophila]|uniref:hypothetical protein n=1 Tax=Thiomicrospira microaerophila TaxID=406020 RepID=UPI0005CAEB5C|nr:hypothetical protein [Thiomicrospira microaerophila]
MNYAEQMKNVFKIADFPAYPSTGNPAKDAEMFAGQFRQVTVLRSDPVYYTDHAAGVSEPSFFSRDKKR